MRINGKLTFEKYYAIYKRKDKLGEVKADELIDFCLQLKLSKAQKINIICHNLTNEDIDKAFHLILPPKKKSIDLLGYLEKNEKIEKDSYYSEPENSNQINLIKSYNIKLNDDDLVIFKTNTYDFKEQQIASIESIREHYEDGIIKFMFHVGYIEFYKA